MAVCSPLPIASGPQAGPPVHRLAQRAAEAGVVPEINHHEVPVGLQPAGREMVVVVGIDNCAQLSREAVGLNAGCRAKHRRRK